VFDNASHHQEKNDQRVLKEEARALRVENNLKLPIFDEHTCDCGRRNFGLDELITHVFYSTGNDELKHTVLSTLLNCEGGQTKIKAQVPTMQPLITGLEQGEMNKIIQRISESVKEQNGLINFIQGNKWFAVGRHTIGVE